MKHGEEANIPFWTAQLTTLVSVSLVLVVLGMIALAACGASNETRHIKEKLEVNAIMRDTVGEAGAKRLAAELSRKPYVLETGVVTKEEALENWKRDTGEDLEALFGVNPLSAEVTFTVKAEYADAASLGRISRETGAMEGVEGVAIPDVETVDAMNRNLEKVSLLMGAVALALGIISFILIGNTVRLSVHSKRFAIHTMQLVGATNGFIRRPFIRDSVLTGAVSGAVASCFLGLCLWAAPGAGFGEVAQAIGWDSFTLTAVSLTILGAVICGVASWVAASRCLRSDYEDLFKE